jgi:hypothetical protein
MCTSHIINSLNTDSEGGGRRSPLRHPKIRPCVYVPCIQIVRIDIELDSFHGENGIRAVE